MKPWYQSKTLFFNLIAAIAAVLPLPLLLAGEAPPTPQGFLGADQALDAANATLPAVEASLPVLREILPAQYYAWLVGLVVVGNVALRAVTQVRLSWKSEKEPK